MNTNAVIVLLVAILILWLAVTDKLTRFIDAYHVITGDSTATTATTATVASVAGTVAAAGSTIQVPSLPTLGVLHIN